MPSLQHLIAALRQYPRYGVLSAYADDVDDLRDGTLLRSENVRLFRSPPNPVWHLMLDQELLVVYVNVMHGLVQVRVTKPSPMTTVALPVTPELRAELETTLGTAATTAAHAKQGQLGDLVLGMLIGNHVPGPAGPVGLRIFAIQYKRTDERWKAYDGTMLAWAKEHLAYDPT